MPFLLDTNVLSEPGRPEPNKNVLAWLRELDPLEAHLSVLTLGEIEKGVSLMAPGPRKTALRQWLAHDLPGRFLGRILPVDAAVASAWGRLDAEGQRIGRPLPVVDGLLLATASAHQLTFVTRDLRDCGDRGVPVLSPWEGPDPHGSDAGQEQ
ncbi:MAG: type II toxin-antitoxin system VapC family toxin [Gemmatimonadota bacterium]|jgi:predicted nucleic acid-binding protein